MVAVATMLALGLYMPIVQQQRPHSRLHGEGQQQQQQSTRCTFPDERRWPHNESGPFPQLDRSLSCAPGSVGGSLATNGVPAGSSYSFPGLSDGFREPTYVDARATVYDNAPEASFVNASRPVKAALLSPDANIINTTTAHSTHLVNHSALLEALTLVKANGADIVLLTEENFRMNTVNEPGASQPGGWPYDGPGEELNGPRISAVQAVARELGLYVIVPFRMLLAAGESYNAAVVVGRDGELVLSTSGVPYYQKVFPCLGYPMGSISANWPGGYAAYGDIDHGGESPLIPGQQGVQVWDLPSIGRIAIIICFDVNFMELWHQAYALGAQVVFWPSMMATPDRDAISAARLFRYHIVANGWMTYGGPADPSLPDVPARPFYSPGTILDSTGRTVKDFHLIGKIGCPCCTPCPSSKMNTTASIGTMDLDATWVHENLPGPQQCPGVGRLCAAYPGVFELPVGGCGHPSTNFSRCHVLGGGNAKYCSGLAYCKGGVSPPDVTMPGDSTMDGPSVFLVRSTLPETHSVRAALREFGVLPYRDGIFAARQGINSLRQNVPTGGTCSFPNNGKDGTPSFDRPLTCQPGTVDSLTRGGSFTLAPADSSNFTPTKGTHTYIDAKPMVYAMESLVSSSSKLVNSTTGQVKVAVGIQSKDLPSLTAELKLAKSDGAQIALLTEEDFGDVAEPLDGPHVTAVRAVAKALSIFIILPLRLSLSKGHTFNAAVVIDNGGSLLNSTAGVPYYQKVMPSGYFPNPERRPSLPGDYPEGVIPGQHGVQVWDLPSIGRIAILICFDINFFELWHQAYALGAQVVFWPSAMQTPDRDMISLARLYRYHIVANGYPGDIVNGMGRRVNDFKTLPGGAQWCQNTPDKTIHNCGVRTGTLDLDATWVHENGPGPLNCRAIAAMCKAHPGVFELTIPSCGQFWNHAKPCEVGCSCGKVATGETVKTDNSVFIVRSKQPDKFSVRTAFRRFGVVPYHDFIKGSRQGLNSLRQAGADIPRPPSGNGKPGSTPSPMPACPTITHENVCVLPLCEWQSGNCVAAPKPPPPPPCPVVPAPCPAPPKPKCPPAPAGAQAHRYWRLHTVPGADEGPTQHAVAPPDWPSVARLWDVCAIDFFSSSNGTGPSAVKLNSTTQNVIQDGAKNPGVARAIFDFHNGPASQCDAHSTTWNGIWQVQESVSGRCGCRASAYIGWDFGYKEAVRSVAIRQFFSMCQNVLVVQWSDDQKCWYDGWYVNASRQCPQLANATDRVTVSPPATQPKPPPHPPPLPPPPPPPPPPPCESAIDCELLGECVAGKCVCEKGWAGDTCGILALAPAPPIPQSMIWPAKQPIPPQYWGDAKTPVAWGSTIVKEGSVYHQFADVGCYQPGRVMHVDGFQLAHSTSDKLTGPYKMVDHVALQGYQPWRGPSVVNPHAVAPIVAGAPYLLFFWAPGLSTPQPNATSDQHGFKGICFGNETALSVNRSAKGKLPPAAAAPPTCTLEICRADCLSECCSSKTSPCKLAGCAQDPVNGFCYPGRLKSGAPGIMVAYTQSLASGKWKLSNVTVPGLPATIERSICDNPSATLIHNSSSATGYTIIMAYRFDGKIGLIQAEGPEGPWSNTGLAKGNTQLGPAINPGRPIVEDPFLWVSQTTKNRGSYHMLFHDYSSVWTGAHAFSPTGEYGTWKMSNRHAHGRGVYNTTIQFTDGTAETFYRRERPELLFAEGTGEVTHLLSGVERAKTGPGPNFYQYSMSLLQPVE